MSKMIEICVEIKNETDNAFLVSDDGKRKNWIPKSQIKMEDDAGIGDVIVITIPEWLAIEKGFV